MMTDFTGEERSYVETLMGQQRRTMGILGAAGLGMSALGGLPLLNLPEGPVFPGNAGELAGWSALVLIFCLSLILLGSVLAGITRMEPAKITGVYRVRFRGRQRWSYLGSRTVRIPSLWDSWFHSGQEYTVRAAECRIGLLPAVSPVLSAEGMPQELAAIPLGEMGRLERDFIGVARREFLRFGLFLLVPVLVILIPVQYFRRHPGAADRFLEAHSDGIVRFFDYLWEHEAAMNLFGILFRYGWILVVLLIIGIYTLTARIPGRSGKKRGSAAVPSVTPDRWLLEYRAFMETRLMPVMTGASTGDPEALREYMKVMDRYGELKEEYRSFLKSLAGGEKKRFLREFRSTTMAARQTGRVVRG